VRAAAAEPLGWGALRAYLGRRPELAEGAYVAEGATLVGRVVVGERSSIWPGAILRADDGIVRLGALTNVQDGAVVHGDSSYPVEIGSRVTIGHAAIVHGCTIEDDVLIGIGATVLDNALVRKGAVVSAGSLVTEGFVVPERSIVRGVPARVIGERRTSLARRMTVTVEAYDQLRASYLNALSDPGS
jgi:carbonic anhydrase/acetyltransferase-like protein (isoleucine patch superfamily)